MSRSKVPSATSRSGRSQPYTVVNPAKPSAVASSSKLSAVPMALGPAPNAKKQPSTPGQPTTCIAYAFQPAHGKEAILLIPTSALKFELREQAGQKVLQFLPPSAAFFPLLKATPVPSAATSAQSQQEQRGAPQTTTPKTQQTTPSASSVPPGTKDKSSLRPAAASDVAAVVEPTFRFQERPTSWSNALRLDYGGKIRSGQASTAPEPYTGTDFKMAPANAFPEQQEIDYVRRQAHARYGSNNGLINRILDGSVVGHGLTWLETESPSRRERIGSLASKVRYALADVERTEKRLDQKMADVAEANELFHYKLDRFQQLAALISSDEFLRATVEAELQQPMQYLDLDGSSSAFF